MGEKLGVDFDKPCLSQQTVGTIFQKSFVPGNIHIGPNCDQPICYWQCDEFGGTCENPNECICP